MNYPVNTNNVEYSDILELNFIDSSTGKKFKTQNIKGSIINGRVVIHLTLISINPFKIKINEFE
jgi:hypothetical protein